MTMKERIAQVQNQMKEARAKVKDATETAQIAAMLTKDELDKKVADTKGDLAAAQENVRIASERAQGKVSSGLLQVQMNIKAAKDSLEEKKTEWDKNKCKDHIEELVNYAEACEAMAAELVLEADLTILQAAAEADEYAEKYGEE